MYLHAKFRRDISIHGWDKTTSGFGKRKAAILEFYFRFRFRPVHQHVILDLPAKFRSNRTIGGGVMTSYRFFKMAAIESEIYFVVGGLRWHLFKKVEVYLLAKFRRDISIHGWDKTISPKSSSPSLMIAQEFAPDIIDIVIRQTLCSSMEFSQMICV